MPKAFVGFYWTLPVNWAGFRNLPNNADEAAAKSKTIRYQREAIRIYASHNAGEIVEEFVFMDTEPDRATVAIDDVLNRVRIACDKHNATMLYVNFQESYFWRSNMYLLEATRRPDLYHENLDNRRIPAIALPPEPLEIGKEEFNPVEHFRKWRRQDEEAMSGFAEQALSALKAALKEIPPGRGRYLKIVTLLNSRGIKTFRGGRLWTVDNARKEIKRKGLDDGGAG